MIRSLDWRSLEQRRVDPRLTILYKIRNHLFAIDENSYLQRATGRREYQYRQLRVDKDYTGFSFFPRTVIQWNQPPSQICLAESPDSFKTQVSKIEHSRLYYTKTFLLSLFLSPSLLPSVFPIPYFSYLSFSILLLPFPFSHSTADNPQIEGIPVYWQKQKAKSKTQWESDWLINFNVAKCHSMRVPWHLPENQI